MILVIGHNYRYTDADSLISSIVLADILNQTGRPAQAVLINPSPYVIEHKTLYRLSFLDLTIPPVVDIETIEDNDLVLVDHNDPIESYGQLGITKQPLLCVDHHTLVNHNIQEIRIEAVGATCTIIAKMAKELGVALSAAQVKALIYGIVIDTRGLTSNKTSEEDRIVLDDLYSQYPIGETVEEISRKMIVPDDITQMSIDEILHCSLKEYADGRVGIANVEAPSAEVCEGRMPEILDRATQMHYEVYGFILTFADRNETLVYYFDKKNRFPKLVHKPRTLSRSKDIVPFVLDRLNQTI
ncbi:DHH family phosphoesterase [Heliobacterium chlorum]|uniref:DHH family phosphoesterase n=1 Tax=Heliobacterium chlorum TaxID=2698 RepID=A0ABR7T974_HELCL|nr:DHH family phosphoesterase [Heliobacterium chlorum]MBC9786246.1 DHH family phosphoesterase [Heliobacterium chlorum]